MAERAGFEPARRLASRRPPGSNRAPCQARSPLRDGGSGGSRTHTVTGFESDASSDWATEPGWCPSSDSNREPPVSETGASARIGLEGRFGASFGKEQKSDRWRRVKESNPRRGTLGAPVFGTGCRTIAAAPSGTLQNAKSPRGSSPGGFWRSSLIAFQSTRRSPWLWPAIDNLKTGASSA